MESEPARGGRERGQGVDRRREEDSKRKKGYGRKRKRNGGRARGSDACRKRDGGSIKGKSGEGKKPPYFHTLFHVYGIWYVILGELVIYAIRYPS